MCVFFSFIIEIQVRSCLRFLPPRDAVKKHFGPKLRSAILFVPITTSFDIGS